VANCIQAETGEEIYQTRLGSGGGALQEEGASRSPERGPVDSVVPAEAVLVAPAVSAAEAAP